MSMTSGTWESWYATLLQVWRMHSFRSVLKQILNTRKTTFLYIELYPSCSTWWLEAIIFIFAISEQQQCKRKLIVYTALIRYQLQIILNFLHQTDFVSLSQILEYSAIKIFAKWENHKYLKRKYLKHTLVQLTADETARLPCRWKADIAKTFEIKSISQCHGKHKQMT